MTSDFLEKRKVFIVSNGRTGTRFFAETLGRILPDCFSIHEPDNLIITSRNTIKNMMPQLRRMGLMNLVFLKALGITGARNISLKRLQGKKSREAAISRFLKDRKWAKEINQELYIESNQQLFGLSEDLAFLPNSKVIYIVRHPLTWVKSWMNKRQSWFGKKDLMNRINFLGFKRLTPKNAGDRVLGWNKFTQLEKLTWLWNFTNKIYTGVADKNYSNVCLVRFEDIFIERKIEKIKGLFDFIVPSRESMGPEEEFLRLLNIHINSSYSEFQDNTEWWEPGREDIFLIKERCSDLMEKLDYR
jgi:hypothetical protein